MKLFILSTIFCHVAAIWPAPQSFTNGSSVVWLAENFRTSYNGHNLFKRPGHQGGHPGGHQGGYLGSEHGSFTSNVIVSSAVKRAQETIFAENFIPWKFHPRNELAKFEPAVTDTPKTYIKKLDITQTGIDDASTFKPLAGAVDESYNLTIGTDGSASIIAVSSTGILRGLETFTQLFYLHSQRDAGIYCNMAPVDIRDAPKFGHRGLNLDVSRNWYPKENILRTIDALSWNKFNRLHIHMTDAQSWPMDIPAMPELSEKGAYQTGLSYTPQDIQDIHVYAIYRGVEVIIEFDMPGHTSSIAFSHPELITAFRAEPWDHYCAEPPCGALKLNSPAVYDFLTKLFNDVLPRVSPYSAYFHTGGDEVNIQDFLLDDTVKSNDTAVLIPLLQKFIDHNHDLVRKAGLVPIVWEEMLLDWKLKLGDDVVVQTWISEEALGQVTALGHKAIFGNYNYWYLDCGAGQWLNFENGQSFQEYYPFNDYCSPLKNWRLIYSYDPTANLSAEQAALVQGGEMHIWSEQTDPANLDTMIWPRGSAAGEVMWSGRQDSSGQNRSQVEASERLSQMRERMVQRRVRAAPVQMVYCTQFGGEECAL